ncbi:MAG: TonB-dependent receptor [Candidatus Acidiferrales bacterium]
MRVHHITSLFVASLAFSSFVFAQSPNGTISGVVIDPSEAAIAGAEITIVNDATRVQYSTKTNNEGIYVVPNLPPGPYRIQVVRIGFKTLIKPDVTLNVQDAVAINFTLPIGAASETVTVLGGAPLVNSESGSVSTVVDRHFVENIPLNGRSFQTLIALTPGVVLTPASQNEQGQFSVNGQRANANYFTVDGVSANVGVNGGFGHGLAQSAAGALPGLSALGGTNALVSVDAMQEFRVQTSSFAPEYGRTPGGQISIATRSGTNDFHGTLFDYFRNDVLDANDWFANKNHLPKPKERQNDFGGVIGGPLIKDRTFFFFSYEGLRLRQPLTQETAVPDAASRRQAPAAIRPFLNGFPVSNGPDLGGGLAQFNASYSNPSTLDAYSLRIDQRIGAKLGLFGRYNYATSEVVQRGPAVDGASVLSNTLSTPLSSQILTIGLAQGVSQRITNELRANYSNVRAGTRYRQDDFGGAVRPPFSSLLPPNIGSGFFNFFILGVGNLSEGNDVTNEQRQVNVVDSLTLALGAHQWKLGVDYRWLSPLSGPAYYSQLPFFLGVTGFGGAVSGTPLETNVYGELESTLLSQNFSVYGQDTWKASPRLTLTYGLRWDVNPPLKGKNNASQLYTVSGLNDPAKMTLAPRGTPLYNVTYANVAPRVGIAFQIKQQPVWETVARGGFGVFYDLGSGFLGFATAGFPFFAFNSVTNSPFPLTVQHAAPPAGSTPADGMYVAVPNLKLPRTYQWNVALEQSLGASQSLSVTYVGSVGRNLLRQETLENPNPNFGVVEVTRNTATSDYNALQLKFQRRLSRGLQALASYTFSHSIDIASNDSGAFNTPSTVGNSNMDRGNSDFDVRHSLTGAVAYDIPVSGSHKFVHAILGDWSMDSFVLARSSAPVDILGPFSFVGSSLFQSRPNLARGIPVYLYGPQYPGGKTLNSNPSQGGPGCTGPFCPAPTGRQGNLGRNVLRGFGAWQADFALRRQFHVTERVGLQFRAEFFNIFNHPNFGSPDSTLGDPFFGQSTQTLASSLGSGGSNGGLNPLYQIGGPRSIQFALKLTF